MLSAISTLTAVFVWVFLAHWAAARGHYGAAKGRNTRALAWCWRLLWAGSALAALAATWPLLAAHKLELDAATLAAAGPLAQGLAQVAPGLPQAPRRLARRAAVAACVAAALAATHTVGQLLGTF